MQIGEVLGRARGPIERLDIGLQLNQIARGEARGQTAMAEKLRQQPGGIAAGAPGANQRLLRRVHARLHPDRVVDRLLDPLVQGHQEIDRPLLFPRRFFEEILEQRTTFCLHQIRREFLSLLLLILEREMLRVLFEEEIEGVDHRHVGDQLDLDAQAPSLLRKHDPREEVPEGVLLPVQEVLLRHDLQAVGANRRARMRRRAQPDHVGREPHGSVEPVVRVVVDRDSDGHGWLRPTPYSVTGSPHPSSRAARNGPMGRAGWLA